MFIASYLGYFYYIAENMLVFYLGNALFNQ